MKVLPFCLGLLLALAPITAQAQAPNFSRWAVLIVAGDDHAHSGAHSEVFDNARKDLARAFAGIGFSPANIRQFSLDPDASSQHTSVSAVANTLYDLTGTAPDGCLIYFTSHGSPDGIVVDGGILPPDRWSAIVDNGCGAKPAVIVMSSCFSGQFVPALAGDNRIILTAARPDRTSFGCGEQDKYTFFDDCFLQALPRSGDFPSVAQNAIACVGQKERQLGATPPSEPQLSIGNKVMFTLRWR